MFINVGRGTTIDEKALIELLTKRRLAAAILDVTLQEPLNGSSPLWEVSNLHLTQHTFGGHHSEIQWKCKFFAKNLKRYLTNKPLLNEVLFKDGF